jgi:hypothetical protein
MDIRRLKTIAVCFGLTAAMLASEDVRPALATPVMGGSSPAAVFWLRSQKAFGGSKAWSNYSHDVEDTVRACADSAECRAGFGKGVGPENLEDARSILNALTTGIRE